jgi:hypothetical protein
VVQNTRFLLLPWVRVPHLASKVLAATCRRLRADWQARYGHDLLLAETFVDPTRFRGTCYRAANWLALGQTVGRGRMDRAKVLTGHAPKAVYVYPLCRKVQQHLCTAPAPAPRAAAEEPSDG